MKISGKSALVTGGASGLGLATVQRLASEGARVVAIDLERSNTAELDKLENVEFVPADVTNEEQVHNAVEVANNRGDLAITVNCAGIGNGIKTAGSKGPFPLDQFRKVIDVNLIGTFNVIRLAAQAMLSNEPDSEERGVIVNTASVAAFDGQIGQAAYTASKAGIVGMTLPIARDLSRDLIRVMTIAPGTFDTPIIDTIPPEIRQSLEKQIPHPSRFGKPAEFADLVAAIIGNPVLNGETIRLDGAIRMAPK
ncbi:SDR family NAD(P)-dependent oxidoreductase [Corynebacterium poyangense]|uniref:SDR family NAD(P)-dependent oxidoreductase n=1 Tax=Corynebacterium poyangense TaxID=2684405 RepID=A0A7H0SR95_9CORY|nr:3-hydroxyacyl-CoA dehydrogenase [Corynebacterium poyangense]MBZ8176502.1 SDR family NAD(P)-dependent oxidoreductase [Corynebacterium poyangense]QNQ91070.1 SDR family NAD(P)-dependent oxidoreductase [Corynebacterium poyangense]